MQSRKEHILTVSASLFRKKGYSATSMNDIAHDVGIKAASIYNHFSSKQEILSQLLQGMADRFVIGMDQIQASSLNPKEKVYALIALHVRMAVEKTDHVALITSEWIHLIDDSKKSYLMKREHYESSFRSIIEDGKSQQLFRNIDTEIILFSTLSTLRWLYSWYSKNKSFNPIELEKQLGNCLLEGILTETIPNP